MKLCKDCAFYDEKKLFRCTRTVSGYSRTNVVTGKPQWVDTSSINDWRDPDTERHSIRPWRCGKKARHFKPKEA